MIISRCCKNHVERYSADCISYYVCDSCGRVCDIIIETPRNQESHDDTRDVRQIETLAFTA